VVGLVDSNDDHIFGEDYRYHNVALVGIPIEQSVDSDSMTDSGLLLRNTICVMQHNIGKTFSGVDLLKYNEPPMMMEIDAVVVSVADGINKIVGLVSQDDEHIIYARGVEGGDVIINLSMMKRGIIDVMRGTLFNKDLNQTEHLDLILDSLNVYLDVDHLERLVRSLELEEDSQC